MRLILIGSILLSTALHSHAVTLGRQEGAAVIGRSLDVSVEALLGSGESLSALCIHSDVFLGDAQLASSAVRVSSQVATSNAKALIRIQTTVPVNEPVVSLLVRAGCGSPFSRRYVLLADPVGELLNTRESANNSAVRSPKASSGGQGLLPSQLGVEGSTVASAIGSSAESKDPSRPFSRNTSSVKVSRPSVVRKPVAARASGLPRLHLDPLDVILAEDRDPILKLSLSLLSEPTSSEQERAAAGQLWKAINASPEDVLRDTQKLVVLEAESKGLREQEASDKAAIKSMQAQLDRSRNLTWLVYLLGALLFLSLLGLWFFRRRQQDPEVSKRDDWWDTAQNSKKAAVHGLVETAPIQTPVGIDLDVSKKTIFDADEPDFHDSFRGALLTSGAGFDHLTATQSAGFVGSRSVATEELFDVQQKADFFVSLGSNDKAIEVLKSHLRDSQDSSALAYLDLFKLYHLQGHQQDYEDLREKFNLKFNASAPPFDQYADKSVGLENYETAFGRIQALWPQPRVLDVIEKSIFRDLDDENGAVFDLEAYRDLLLLHAVVKEVTHLTKADDEPLVDFQHTSIKPLKAMVATRRVRNTAEIEGPSTVPHNAMAMPPMHLDFDLDALSEKPSIKTPASKVSAEVESVLVKSKRLEDDKNLSDLEELDFMPPYESSAGDQKNI